MVTYSRTSSFVIAVLRIFRSRIGVGNAWTIEEIWQAYLDNHFRNFGYFESSELKRRLPVVLQLLAELDLVALDDSSKDYSGFQRWRIGDSWRPPEAPPGGNGGGDNVDPRAGDDDDGSGGGLREALGHPVLLSLSEGDFDELVSGLFKEVQP